MKRKFLFTAMLLVMAIVTAACGSKSPADTNGAATPAPAAGSASATEVKIKHQLGEVPVKVNPKKIVVFDYGILDSLDKLGIEVTGVPQASLPPYLKKYKDAKYTNVGSLQEPDFEKINALKPDVILISGRQQKAYEELNKIAPTVYMAVDTKKYMESFKENMNWLGQIFAKEAEIKAELEKIEASIKTVNDAATASGKNGLILLANEGAISAFGPNSRFGIIHDVLGVKPVDPNIEVSSHGNPVTFEYIAEKNPDYLFVIDRNVAVGGEAAGKKSIENELVKKTKAFQNGKIIYLDPNYWYLSGGGLASVDEMVKAIDAAVK